MACMCMYVCVCTNVYTCRRTCVWSVNAHMCVGLRTTLGAILEHCSLFFKKYFMCLGLAGQKRVLFTWNYRRRWLWARSSKPNQSSLEEQQMFLVAEPSLQPPHLFWDKVALMTLKLIIWQVWLLSVLRGSSCLYFPSTRARSVDHRPQHVHGS